MIKIIRIIPYTIVLILAFSCNKNNDNYLKYNEKIVLTENNNSLYNINGIDIYKNSIYISDAVDFSIKKYNFKNQLISKNGRKGNGPAEFITPYKIKVNKNLIAVIDNKTRFISIFDTNLVFLQKFKIKVGSPYNLCWDKHDNLVVLAFDGEKTIIEKYSSTKFQLLESVFLKRPGYNSLYTFFHVFVDNKDNLILGNYFKNIIIIKDNKNNTTEYAIKDINRDDADIRDIPKVVFINDLCADFEYNEIIYLLNTEENDENKKEILFTDYKGIPQNKILINHNSSFLIKQNNKLYITKKNNTELAEINYDYRK